eukprot:5528713-Amphidinium_carterae.1
MLQDTISTSIVHTSTLRQVQERSPAPEEPSALEVDKPDLGWPAKSPKLCVHTDIHIIRKEKNVGKRKRWNEHLFLNVLGFFGARGVSPTFSDSSVFSVLTSRVTLRKVGKLEGINDDL